jgi:hypothetical protein
MLDERSLDSICGDQHQARRAFVSFFKESLVTVLLLAIGIASVVLLVGMVIWRNWATCMQSGASVGAFQSTGLLACGAALVGIVSLSIPVLIALMSDGALMARAEFTIPKPRNAGDTYLLHPMARLDLHDLAMRHWHYHESQAWMNQDRRFRHALCYATLTTFWICLLAVVLLYGLSQDGSGSSSRLMQAALTLFAGVIARFVLDVGNMVVRSARRDSTARMFAQAAYHITITIFAAGVARLLLAIGEPTSIKSPLVMSILAGVCAAALGERVLGVLLVRLGKLFGVEPPPRTNGLPLTFLDGLDASEASRLEEEGIDSIHALAYTSVPKLFFRTPFGLGQVCDWQDQAILVTQLGDERAVQFRKQLGISRATEVLQLAIRFQNANEKQRDELLASMSLGGVPTARAILEKFLVDDGIAMLVLYQLAAPRNAEPRTYTSGTVAAVSAMSSSAAQ